VNIFLVIFVIIASAFLLAKDEGLPKLFIVSYEVVWVQAVGLQVSSRALSAASTNDHQLYLLNFYRRDYQLRDI
jgi:hypothetical protein